MRTTHNAIDSWEPPKDANGNPTIEVYQVAGWGLDTIRGIHYDDCDTFACRNTLATLDRELMETQEGDGTVVSPSATAMDAPTFYLDLPEHNREGLLNQRRNRSHADILEVAQLQELIKQIIFNELDLNSLPAHISLQKPEAEDSDKRLHIRGLSPISIDVYDTAGNHTGPVPNSNLQLFEAQIPNSYYYKIGEKTYLGLDTRDQYRVEIDGLAFGSFTLEIDEVFDDEVVDSTTYTNIPVTPTTKAILTTQTVNTTSNLSLDVQGDGTPDVTISPSADPDPKASLKVLKSVVSTLTVQKGVKNAIIKQIEAAEKLLNKGLVKAADSILKGLVKQLQNFPKFLINPTDAQTLIQIIETIRASLV